jgi:hypothetical protein
MKGAHAAKVKTVVDKIGTQRDKSAFAAASELLGQCAEGVDCYLSKLKDDDASGGFVGVKAAHMVAMLGDTRAGMEIVKLLPTVRNADVRAAAILALDHVVQKDAPAVADALQKLLDDQLSDGPGPLATTSAEQVVYRLRAR